MYESDHIRKELAMFEKALEDERDSKYSERMQLYKRTHNLTLAAQQSHHSLCQMWVVLIGSLKKVIFG